MDEINVTGMISITWKSLRTIGVVILLVLMDMFFLFSNKICVQHGIYFVMNISSFRRVDNSTW